MAEIILKPIQKFQILRNQLTYKKQNYYKIEGNKINLPWLGKKGGLRKCY